MYYCTQICMSCNHIAIIDLLFVWIKLLVLIQHPKKKKKIVASTKHDFFIQNMSHFVHIYWYTILFF